VGQVFQSLQTLELKGLVRESTDPRVAPDGRGPGRNRRTYTITEKGERTLERWLRRAPTRPRPLRDEILLRLLAATRSGTTSTLQVLAASERAHRDRLERAIADRRRASDQGPALGRLGLEAEIAHLETHLDWLALCRRALVGDAALEAAPSGTIDSRPPARATSTDPVVARRSIVVKDRA
jgi:DNA-binding PadR family transcriptional regulator